MDTRTLRTMVAEDEPAARDLLVRLLREHPDVEVVAEAADGGAARERIEALRPDLVFLDIEMPHLDGLGVLAALTLRPLPAAVFVTAYSEFAVSAFDASAVDYILKPFSQARLARALDKVRLGALRAPDYEGLARRLATGQSGRIALDLGGRVLFEDVRDIVWIEADARHARVYRAGGMLPVRTGISALEEKLARERFRRISRSAIVNVDRIAEIVPQLGGDYVVVMMDGTRLRSTRAFKAGLDTLIGKKKGA